MNVSANDGSATGSDPHTITINNVAPTVTFTSGDTTVNESGVTLHTYPFTVSDPGDDTVIGNGTTCGVGGTQVGPTTPGFLPPPSHPMGTTFSFDCRFDDGPKDPDVQANATDSDNATGAFTTFDVHVNNVAPTATLRERRPDQRGRLGHVSFSSQFDPSPTDTTAGFHYAFSCTNGSLAGATYAGSGTASSTSCTFNDNGSFPVKGRIIDKDGGFTEYTTTVTVNNVAPTATLANNGPVNEGSPATSASAARSTRARPTRRPASTTPSTATAAAWPARPTPARHLADDDLHVPRRPADEVVSGAIIDKDGGLTQYTTTVHVNNVAPTVTFTSGDTTVNESGVTLHTYTFTVSDPGDDTVIGNGTTCRRRRNPGGPDDAGLPPAAVAPDGHDVQLTTAASTTVRRTRTFRPTPPTPTTRPAPSPTSRRPRQQRRPDGDPRNNGPISEGGPATSASASQFDPSPDRHDGRLPLRLQLHQRQPRRRDLRRLGRREPRRRALRRQRRATVKGRIIDKDGGFTEYTTDVEVTTRPRRSRSRRRRRRLPSTSPRQCPVYGRRQEYERCHRPVTILTLTDSAFGPLDGLGDCDISPDPVVLAAAASYECSFTAGITGDGPASHSNTVTATAEDDDFGGTDAPLRRRARSRSTTSPRRRRSPTTARSTRAARRRSASATRSTRARPTRRPASTTLRLRRRQPGRRDLRRLEHLADRRPARSPTAPPTRSSAARSSTRTAASPSTRRPSTSTTSPRRSRSRAATRRSTSPASRSTRTCSRSPTQATTP